MNVFGVRTLAFTHYTIAQEKYSTRITTSSHIAMAIVSFFPPELLTIIFKECIADTILSTNDDPATRTAIAFSQVCSWWRQVASIPNLWIRLRIDICEGCRNPLSSILETWLGKSQGLPLNIKLRIGRDSGADFDPIRRLMKEISRWKTLRIYAETSRLLSYFLNKIEPAPALETVYVTVRQSGSWWHYQHPLDRLEQLRNRFAGSPRLCWIGIDRNVIATTETIPLRGSIFHLSLEYTAEKYTMVQSTGALVELLQELPQLKSLNINIPFFDKESIGTPHVDMMNLTKLLLEGADNVFAFLPRIRAPNLTNLTISRSGDSLSRNPLLAKSILDFLKASHSPPPIYSLELYNVPEITDQDFTRIFALLPSLEKLVIHNSSISDATVQELILCESNVDGLRRCLKRLELCVCENVHEQNISSAVRSRISRGAHRSEAEACLQVLLVDCPPVRKYDIKFLQPLVNLCI
uniref:F-box domain-containing protein n=1 Tax=Psilocybe cubensis TaxID=181762 RepID=A0A8H7Y2K1_PSICU